MLTVLLIFHPALFYTKAHALNFVMVEEIIHDGGGGLSVSSEGRSPV